MSKVEQIPSLAALQTWDNSDFAAYEPCCWGGNPSPKRVIQTIVKAAHVELDWRGERNANSLRDFWYNPTKPILERAFPEKLADPEFDFVRRMSQYLSETLSEMVQEGTVTYRSLNILDESRERELHLHSVEHDKILFVEKEAAYRKLRPLEEVYELSIVSGGGWQATALIEDLAHELDPSTEYTLFVLTDYDPTGWEIARDFRRRSRRLGVNIDDVVRVGILPEQLDDDTIERQRFSPPVNSDRDRDWLAAHGIGGQYGLEIEAIGDLNEKGEALRRMVVGELREHIDETERQRRDTNRALANGARDAVESVVDDITGDLRGAIREVVIDELDDQRGVEQIRYDDEKELYFGAADLEAAKGGASHLPEPFDENDLHDGAVEGERPVTDQSPVSSFARKRVRERIETGELRPTDLLNTGGER